MEDIIDTAAPSVHSASEPADITTPAQKTLLQIQDEHQRLSILLSQMQATSGQMSEEDLFACENLFEGLKELCREGQRLTSLTQLTNRLNPLKDKISTLVDSETNIPVGKGLIDTFNQSGCTIRPPSDSRLKCVATYSNYVYLREGRSMANVMSFSNVTRTNNARLAMAFIHEAHHTKQFHEIPATALSHYNTATPVILTPLDHTVMNILLESTTSAFEAYMASLLDPLLPGTLDNKNTITGKEFREIRANATSLSDAFEEASIRAMETHYKRSDAPRGVSINFFNYYIDLALTGYKENYENRNIPSKTAPPVPIIGALTTKDMHDFCNIAGVKISPNKTIEELRRDIIARMSPQNRALLNQINIDIMDTKGIDVDRVYPAEYYLNNLGTSLEALHQKSIAPVLAA